MGSRGIPGGIDLDLDLFQIARIFGATDDAAILNRKSRSSSLRESLKDWGTISREVQIGYRYGFRRASVVDGTQKQMLLSMMHTS